MKVEEIDPREVKLPQWVQEKLASLRRQLQCLEEVKHYRDTLKPEQAEPNVWVVMRGEKAERIEVPIPKGASVEMDTGAGIVELIERKGDGWCELYSDHALVIQPQATNVIRFKAERW